MLVGEIPIDAAWTDYYVRYKTWLKKLTWKDYRLLNTEQHVRDTTPKNQLVLEMWIEHPKRPYE